VVVVCEVFLTTTTRNDCKAVSEARVNDDDDDDEDRTTTTTSLTVL
jgi:hypothetical protein